MTILKCSCCQQEISIAVFSQEQQARIVLSIVGQFYGLTAAEIKAHSRAVHYSFPRMVAMYMIRHLTGMQIVRIAHLLDKERTTVTHGLMTIQNEIDCGSLDGKTVLTLRHAVEQAFARHSLVETKAA